MVEVVGSIVVDVVINVVVVVAGVVVVEVVVEVVVVVSSNKISVVVKFTLIYKSYLTSPLSHPVHLN